VSDQPTLLNRAGATDQRHIRILLVEDNPVDAELLELDLTSGGYVPEMLRVQSGPELHQALQTESWDIVLSDFALPGFSGIEALEILNESKKDIPFILISGSAGEDVAVRAMKAGAQDFFVKGKTSLLVPAIQREVREAKLRSSARQQHERALDDLWRSEERLRLLVNAVRDFAIFMVDPDSRIATWNVGAERLTGYTTNEAIGQPLSILRTPEASPIDEMLARLASEGSAEWDSICVRKDHSRYVSRSYGATMLGRGGELLGYVFILRDITEQRDLEARLARTQKLESLGQLAGGIAHDFNNMLMVIFARCELLSRQLESEKHRQYVSDIHAAAAQNRDLTHQLLAAARQQVLEPQVVNVNEVIASAMKLLGPTLGERFTIRTDLELSLWSVYADPGKLHQVLVNLAINARDAMTFGGTLTVESRNVTVDAANGREEHGLRAGDYIAITVTDTGTGIPEGVRDRIFDPFFTTKEPGRGTGLGLAVVRGVIEQTGGVIAMDTEEGRGTTFRIFLPRHTAESRATAAAAARKTVLLVEDEDMTSSIVRETVEHQGYRVIAVRSAAEALAISERSTETIHLLLMDAAMPGISGRKLAEMMIAQRPGLPVILMSGYPDHAHQPLPPSMRTLEKPIPMPVLVRTIRAAMHEP
jgi:two-component system cell cycle sensor histidine kinase/response regulator CckA